VRLLAVTDLHYRLPAYDWLLGAAVDADVVAISGDLLDIVSPVPHEAQALVASTYLERLAERTTVLASSGNHDLDGPGPDGEQVAGWLSRLDVPDLHTDGAGIDAGGIRWSVVPWWDGPATREQVGAQLATAAHDRPDTWVWVYHSPPAGTRLCFDGRRSFPDDALAGWIETHRPTVVLCGHIHQAPWVDGGGWYDRLGTTMVINPGKQIGAAPPHVWIDTDAGTATWTGLGETESAPLQG
jgi:Icc-related predicted phosphoesterase